jgi:hypothetical protein
MGHIGEQNALEIDHRWGHPYRLKIEQSHSRRSSSIVYRSRGLFLDKTVERVKVPWTRIDLLILVVYFSRSNFTLIFCSNLRSTTSYTGLARNLLANDRLEGILRVQYLFLASRLNVVSSISR